VEYSSHATESRCHVVESSSYLAEYSSHETEIDYIDVSVQYHTISYSINIAIVWVLNGHIDIYVFKYQNPSNCALQNLKMDGYILYIYRKLASTG
jgi:hypothetical protein